MSATATLDPRALAVAPPPPPRAAELRPIASTGKLDAPAPGDVGYARDGAGEVVLIAYRVVKAREAKPAANGKPAVEAREASAAWKRTAYVADFGRAQMAGILA